MADFDYRTLDELIHSRIRLAVVSILSAVEFADFRFLREKTGATDGNLGAHIGKLENAGYVSAEKLFVERKPVTRYRLTPEGKAAFQAYVIRLGEMVRLEDAS